VQGEDPAAAVVDDDGVVDDGVVDEAQVGDRGFVLE
jgi:hypothetical protein